MLALDHVILAAGDIDVAGTDLAREHGLASLPGVRHAGHGTGNRIVPLGDAYIEIMGVVDEAEAAASPMGRWLRERAADGDCLAAVCLRTEAIDPLAQRLGLCVQPMSRDAPGGVTLSWRLAGLAEAMADPSRPFFIDWDIPADQHPARGAAPTVSAPPASPGRSLRATSMRLRPGSAKASPTCGSSLARHRACGRPSRSKMAGRFRSRSG